MVDHAFFEAKRILHAMGGCEGCDRTRGYRRYPERLFSPLLGWSLRSGEFPPLPLIPPPFRSIGEKRLCVCVYEEMLFRNVMFSTPGRACQTSSHFNFMSGSPSVIVFLGKSLKRSRISTPALHSEAVD